MLGAHKVRGSNLPARISTEVFKSFTEAGNLTHILTRGSTFTWSNGRRGHSLTEKRLDRGICNEEWLDFWYTTSYCTLVRSKSDHFPLLLVANKAVSTFPSSFKFHKMWIQHSDCRRLIQEVWFNPVQGCPMFILSQKLKYTKAALKDWNKNVFGNVHLRVEKVMEAVNSIQQQISDEGASDSLLQ